MKTETQMILDYISAVEERSETRHDKLELKMDKGFSKVCKDIKVFQNFRLKIIGGSVMLSTIAAITLKYFG